MPIGDGSTERQGERRRTIDLGERRVDSEVTTFGGTNTETAWRHRSQHANENYASRVSYNNICLCTQIHTHARRFDECLAETTGPPRARFAEHKMTQTKKRKQKQIHTRQGTKHVRTRIKPPAKNTRARVDRKINRLMLQSKRGMM